MQRRGNQIPPRPKWSAPKHRQQGMTVHGVISDVHDQDVRGDRGFTRVDAPALSPSPHRSNIWVVCRSIHKLLTGESAYSRCLFLLARHVLQVFSDPHRTGSTRLTHWTAHLTALGSTPHGTGGSHITAPGGHTSPCCVAACTYT